jgi:GT2 family glycosyltransferase
MDPSPMARVFMKTIKLSAIPGNRALKHLNKTAEMTGTEKSSYIMHKKENCSTVEISFIIINWNTCRLLIDCLSSIQETVSEYRYEVLVVDNGSADGSPAEVRKHFGERVHLIENRENRGFARANNQALRIAKGKYVVLLNSDTLLRQDTIKGLVEFLEKNPSAAMAGPRMTGATGKVQNSYDNFPSLATELLNKSVLRALFPGKYSGKTIKSTEPFEVDSLIGACIAIRSQVLKQVGLLDESYFFFLEETDLCLRIHRDGWKIYHLPRVEIVHLQGQSKKLRPALAWIEYYRSLYIFFKKHRSRWTYLLLRVCRFIKLTINLLLTVLGLCLTLSTKRRLREKTAVYARLIWWHLCLCPESVGLKKNT